MKQLDRYIFFSYLSRLVAAFIILMTIFIIQTLWLYIDELAGKGLEPIVIIKFLIYYSPKLLPLVLPLSVVLASIMTYGAFGENYEFIAMKSAGISLLRAMRLLIIFHILMGVGSFYISNSLIPYSEVKSYNLRRNLAKLKPSLAIKEAVFNDIGSINIKVDRKYGENDKMLEDVIIHQKTSDKKNKIVIKAELGELSNDTDDNILQLILYRGKRYEEIDENTLEEKQTFPHAKAYFEKYIMNIDISNFNNVDLQSEQVVSVYRMQKVNQLTKSIDTLERDFKRSNKVFQENFIVKNGIGSLPKIDSIPVKDSLRHTNLVNFVAKQAVYKRAQIIDRAIGYIPSIISTLQSKKRNAFFSKKRINLHIITLQDKYALGLMPILMFFIGASIGALIRKGGIGLPIVISIVIFISYYYIGILSKNAAEDDSINPVLASWMSNILVAPFAYLLTRRVNADKTRFNINEFFIYISMLIIKPFRKKKDVAN